MNQLEDLSKQPVDDESEEADSDHERDRQNRCRDPLFARRPRDAAQLQENAAHEFTRVTRARSPIRCDERTVCGCSVVAATRARAAGRALDHEKDLSEKLAGRTGLEPATDGFGDRNSTN